MPDAGFRSPLWLLGIGAEPEPEPVPLAGYRSPLWLLGLGAVTPVVQTPGYRSLLAFWMGGASFGAAPVEDDDIFLRPVHFWGPVG